MRPLSGWVNSNLALASERHLSPARRSTLSQDRTPSTACGSCGAAAFQPSRRRAELAKATGALWPVCRGRCANTSSPWSDCEAINPSRQTGAQRRERSTPNVRQMSFEWRTNVKLQPAGLDRKRRPLRQLRRSGPRWLRRTNVKLRIASIPSWAKPVQQGSRTQVSVVGNLGESQTVRSLSPICETKKTPCVPPPRILLQRDLGQRIAPQLPPQPPLRERPPHPGRNLASAPRSLRVVKRRVVPADRASWGTCAPGLCCPRGRVGSSLWQFPASPQTRFSFAFHQVRVSCDVSPGVTHPHLKRIFWPLLSSGRRFGPRHAPPPQACFCHCRPNSTLSTDCSPTTSCRGRFAPDSATKSRLRPLRHQTPFPVHPQYCAKRLVRWRPSVAPPRVRSFSAFELFTLSGEGCDPPTLTARCGLTRARRRER